MDGVAHYSIGVTFAALLLAVYGLEWARNPTPLPALTPGMLWGAQKISQATVLKKGWIIQRNRAEHSSPSVYVLLFLSISV